MAKSVSPDGAGPVMGPRHAYRTLLDRTPVEYFDTLPTSESDLIERIRRAEIVINIRSSCRFTQNVFARCGQLRLLSLWGTGTDNLDLPAAARHGGTVTNTPGVAAISLAQPCLALMLSVTR